MSEKKTDLKNTLIIIFVYIISNWLLLVVTGYWWDDSVVRDLNRHELGELYSKTGSVFGDLFAYIMIAFRHSYKAVTFFAGMLSCILLYLFLRKSEIFEEKECFWIGLLFTIIPINDARMTYICFPYTICFFLFLFAVYLVPLWKKNAGVGRWIIRALTWVLLFVSYSTASLLVYTGLILLCLYYIDVKNNLRKNVKEIMTSFLKSVLANIDYVILPCVFFVIKSLFFQPYGNYENYNVVSVGNVIISALKAPFAVACTLYNVINSNISIIKSHYLLAGLIILFSLVSGVYVRRKAVFSKGKIEPRDIVLFLIGIIAFVAGLFPYTVVGRTYGVFTRGVAGRDSMLLGIGLAMCIFYGVKIVFADWMGTVCYLTVIMFGVLYFNSCYLQYQREWYEELELEKKIVTNKEIVDNNTFWVVFNYEKPCGTGVFYYLNMNAYKIFGDQTRYFVSSISNLLDSNMELLSEGYGMNEYDASDMKIDGIIVFDNDPISDIDILKLRWKETFNKKAFESEIQEKDRVEYISVSKDQAEAIVDAYNDGITDNMRLIGIAFQNNEKMQAK